MFRRTHTELPDRVAQNDANGVPFGLSVAARGFFASRGVEGLGTGDSQRANALDRHCREKQRGIATVEFAIAVPVLLLLMLVAAEAGRWLYQYNTLHKAVRDGVRYLAQEAITGTTGVIDITPAKRDATRNVVVYGNTGGTGDPVLPGLSTGQIEVTAVDAVHVQVEVGATAATRYNYVPIFASGIPTFSGGGNIDFNIDMTASAAMRAL